jgi:hypothetical protein
MNLKKDQKLWLFSFLFLAMGLTAGYFLGKIWQEGPYSGKYGHVNPVNRGTASADELEGTWIGDLHVYDYHGERWMRQNRVKLTFNFVGDVIVLNKIWETNTSKGLKFVYTNTTQGFKKGESYLFPDKESLTEVSMGEGTLNGFSYITNRQGVKANEKFILRKK